jgi:hypothetical protein
MTTGYIVNGQCVDVAASSDIYFSLKPGATAPGLTTFEHIYTKVDGVWKIKSVTYSSTGVPNYRFEVPAFIPNFATCELSVTDSLQPGLPEGFDYSILGALWAFAFSVVVGLYFFGRSAGVIVGIFKPK